MWLFNAGFGETERSREECRNKTRHSVGESQHSGFSLTHVLVSRGQWRTRLGCGSSNLLCGGRILDQRPVFQPAQPGKEREARWLPASAVFLNVRGLHLEACDVNTGYSDVQKKCWISVDHSYLTNTPELKMLCTLKKKALRGFYPHMRILSAR